ncbi:hypothetical protein KGQ20_07710 [Catenulispora sp. NF23]|uniref:Asp23/Gls24 family envelope stress response protein n=1 Tax=Catenulispora pinistramenti TaxID=2705254 RepID=A0ABS5KNI5_9ACTN|nr:hypothetical protein [Catenulispora pinistramenti]MBS2532657.1 hypothetical protein [Catenulispora pinistramenti]MBS2547586.1 hypothetical protein [Catenulispora pinistramenti]
MSVPLEASADTAAQSSVPAPTPVGTPAAERGSLSISDRALAHLSEHAARETLGTWGPAGHQARVRVHFGRGRRVAHAWIEVPYPRSAAAAAAEVSGHLAERLDALADTRVRRVAVRVSYIAPASRPATETASQTQSDNEPDGGPRTASAAKPIPHARTLPTVIAASAVGSVAALALAVVIQRRYHYSGRLGSWARSIADAHPSSGAVVAGAVGLVVVGLVALVCALAPRRTRLEMVTGDPRLHAAISPGAVSSHLRHAVRDVDMAAVVTVRRGRTARVRLTVKPADSDAALVRARQIQEQAPATFAAPRLRVRARVRMRKARVQ